MSMTSFANPRLAKVKNTARRKMTADFRGIVRQGDGLLMDSDQSFDFAKVESQETVCSAGHFEGMAWEALSAASYESGFAVGVSVSGSRSMWIFLRNKPRSRGGFGIQQLRNCCSSSMNPGRLVCALFSERASHSQLRP